jgi:MFS family permease
MFLFTSDMRAVLWIAVIPAAIAVLLVVFSVGDRVQDTETGDVQSPIRVNDLKRLSRIYWGVVAIGAVFTLARFSEAFLILKASADGLPPALAPLVMVLMALVYALGAYPAGALADRIDASRLLLLGVAVLIAADLSLAFSSGITGSFLGIALWGGHMALTQGLLAKLVAEHSPERLRGSAFGVFNLVTGGSLLFASALAGLLWDQIGPAATFLTGAMIATIAGGMTLGWRRSTEQ